MSEATSTEAEQAEVEEADASGTEDSGERTGLPEARKISPASSSGWRATFERYELWVVVLAAFAILFPGIWSFGLIDPWETHYGEVARRMLEDQDWIHLHWQEQSFRSKPVLTFWLMAGSMKTLGVAADGGYSGELADGVMGILAIRLPFMLFAVCGLVMTWYMLARLVSRRVAWIGFLTIATSPFFFLVARQGITDMPMVASLMGALACFALAVEAGDEGLEPIWKKLNSLHVFMGSIALIVGGQLLYLFFYLRAHPKPGPGVKMTADAIFWPLVLAAMAWVLTFLPKLTFKNKKAIKAWPVTTKRQVYMLWFFTFVGISVLAKGPPGIALAGLVCLLYFLITWDWKLLLKLEILRGAALTALVVVPWHLAMFFKDGRPWSNEYFNHHMLKRFGKGVHGDRGTFDYFAEQIGVGMWPWVALLPIAIAAFVYTGRRDTREGRVRLIIGIWAIAGVATFCASETKFHHYMLPAVPAMALLVAFWIDDYISGRIRRASLGIWLGIPIIALICRDFIGEQKQLIELFIYRYNRAWPSGDPWNVDLSGTFLFFGLLFSALLVALSIHRFRRYAAYAFLGAALAWAYWTMNGYMGAAAPHWGQKALHETYLAQRSIHGVDIKYYGLRDLADDWANERDYKVRSVLPDGFATGLPMKVTLLVPGAGVPGDKVVMNGSVSKLGDNAFWISVSAAERAKLSELIAKGRSVRRSRRRPWVQVNADRLVAWQLNWRGENFWSGGEIYGETDDTKTVFMDVDNKKFLEWIKKPERAGRTFFVVTEASRAKNLKGILPTPTGKETVEVIDNSCNKFTLLRFTL